MQVFVQSVYESGAVELAARFTWEVACSIPGVTADNVPLEGVSYLDDGLHRCMAIIILPWYTGRTHSIYITLDNHIPSSKLDNHVVQSSTSLVATMFRHVERKALRRLWSYHVHRLPVVIKGTTSLLHSLHLPAWLGDHEMCHPSQPQATLGPPVGRPGPAWQGRPP
jgi:hypothetical protein